MIIYSASRREFGDDVRSNRIEDRILDALQLRAGKGVGRAEVASWRNSLQYMHNVLDLGEIDANAGVAIEYTIPQTAKRVDFILTGQDEARHDTAIIVELKQWTEATVTELDGIVETFVGKARREVSHPSYQAWTYAALIRDFNEAAHDDKIRLVPCAYLHNCTSPETILDERYREHLEQAPAYLREDAEKLARFLRQHVRHGDADNILYRIEHGRIRPSKNLADHLVSLLNGNREFLLIDDQKVVYEQALALSDRAQRGEKQVLIVEGGPGTGKSVVAINLLVELTRRRLVAHYVTRNAAPRDVYLSKLTGSFTKTYVTNLFRGSGAYTKRDPDSVDALVVDEAHRLNAKSGMFQAGENQIKEIIETAKLSIFFIDEDQQVTWKDIGETAEIRRWAEHADAAVTTLELSSQFRCNGSDGYLAWLDHALQIRETANDSLDGIDFEFEVFDDPNDLRAAIVEKNRAKNKARLVAGYCWDWKGKKDPDLEDVTIPEHDFSMRWNLGSDGFLWIVKPESVSEIGCIHTCQGLELDWVGVIVGPDLVVRDGEVETDGAARSNQDSSMKGYKTLLKKDPATARRRADQIIRNTYRTLMTRGQKGCYLHCTDLETNAYFKQFTARAAARPAVRREPYEGLPLRLVPAEDVGANENCVPIFDLDVAAGYDFGKEHLTEARDWVELPEDFRSRPGHFVTRVVGESMNRRIPNGSWCLFRADPAGSRDGRVVLVQHPEREDPESGARCTVKVYRSRKRERDDGWVHEVIELIPDSTLPGYSTIRLDEGSAGVRVVGELVAVLGSTGRTPNR